VGGIIMSKTQPIRDAEDIQRLKQYFLIKHQLRNYTMVTLDLNTSLRIGDLLSLKWGDVYNFTTGHYRKHLVLTEQKTEKQTIIALNREATASLELYRTSMHSVSENTYIFKSRTGNNQPISRISAFRIIKKAAADLNMEGTISCHSLRKTFGYHAWKKGIPPALIMSIYNHSSIEITKRYLCIDQDDKDKAFLIMNL
jgi:integrase